MQSLAANGHLQILRLHHRILVVDALSEKVIDLCLVSHVAAFRTTCIAACIVRVVAVASHVCATLAHAKQST